jgi:prepilin-type processing-associated H-X9-DG protein
MSQNSVPKHDRQNVGVVAKMGTNHTTTPLVGAYYTNTMHNLRGNVCMGDGSVQQYSTSRAKEALKQTDDSLNTLAFPGDETQLQ